MFKSTRHKVTIAVAAAAMLLVLVPTSTFAASKVVDNSGQNIPVEFEIGVVCSDHDFLKGKSSFHFTTWDNGHWELQSTFKGSLINGLTGKKTGNFASIGHFSGETGGLPYHEVFNIVVTCVGSGGSDSFSNVHVGVTIDENGVFHVHGL
jgi:hypothetical protein